MNGDLNCDLHNRVAVNSASVTVTDVMSITVLTKVIMKKIAVMGLSVENMIGMMNLMDWLVVKYWLSWIHHCLFWVRDRWLSHHLLLHSYLQRILLLHL